MRITTNPALCADLELIPPFSDQFDLYGPSEAIDRARQWALSNHYLLARDVSACAHGFYGFTYCPGGCREAFRQLDHANMWVAEVGFAFLLSAPYSQGIDSKTFMYADAHGLEVEQGSEDDGWYGKRTIPIWFSSGLVKWPLEEAASQMLKDVPIDWPDE
jgi:hypothetical protein